MASALALLGLVGVLVGFIWILSAAFGESILWGVAILFVSPLAFIYGIMRWDELKSPTLMLGAGVIAQFLRRAMTH